MVSFFPLVSSYLQSLFQVFVFLLVLPSCVSKLISFVTFFLLLTLFL